MPVKKGRHRRYEEARAFKRSLAEDDIESLMQRLDDDPFGLPDTRTEEDAAAAAPGPDDHNEDRAED
ncbi:MAG: hypothetical protein GY745_10595 [Actinomycetia bacterium]|nr:hypothetical protein [Actinomycetes bacterium]MCP4085484.1 hypothetical protein [Actinomycetes bacterium]